MQTPKNYFWLLHEEQYLPQKDFSCCRHSVNIEAEYIEDYEDLFTPFDDLDNLSEDDGDEEAMLNLVESLDEDYEKNFTHVFPVNKHNGHIRWTL